MKNFLKIKCCKFAWSNFLSNFKCMWWKVDWIENYSLKFKKKLLEKNIIEKLKYKFSKEMVFGFI